MHVNRFSGGEERQLTHTEETLRLRRVSTVLGSLGRQAMYLSAPSSVSFGIDGDPDIVREGVALFNANRDDMRASVNLTTVTLERFTPEKK